jgi:ADP-heptose:LPS heptosyltransferase
VNRRVLVVRLDSVGDVLVTSPGIRAITGAPGTEVWMLCGPQGESATRLLPGLAGVLVWDCPWISAAPGAVTGADIDRLVERIRELALDEAVVFTSFHQSALPTALLLRLAGVPHITAASVDYAGSLLDHRLRPGDDLLEDVPEPERAVAIAGAAGYELPAGDDGRLKVQVPASTVVPTLPTHYVVLHPGASAPARTWPAASFARAARELAGLGIRTVVTGDAAERELTAQVAGDHGVDLGGALDLAQLAVVLARADVVVVGNTGPAHLAAAVGTPVVSLFSPVVPAVRWAPYGVPTVLLGDQLAPCRASRSRVCPVPGHPCLTGVEPAEVVDACLRLMAADPEEVPA